MELNLQNSNLIINDTENLDQTVSSFHDQSFESEENHTTTPKNFPEFETSSKDFHTITNKRNSQDSGKKSSNSNNFIIPTIQNNFPKLKVLKYITFSGNGEAISETLPIMKFGYSKDQTITTFLFDMNTYSQFTNPEQLIENDKVKVYVLMRNKTKDKFTYQIEDIIEKLSMSNNNKDNVCQFIEGLNKIFTNDEYLKLKNKNCFNKYFTYISLISAIIAIVAFITLIIFAIIHKQIAAIVIYIFLSALMGLFVFFQISKLKKFEIVLKWNILQYMVNKYASNVDYVEAWNRSIFETNNIKASIPFTVDYILFNLDPTMDINIKDLDMLWMKKQFHPEKDFSMEEKRTSMTLLGDGINESVNNDEFL